jgi:hypothetical protein
MERTLGNEASAALIGMIVGYALSGFTRSE